MLEVTETKRVGKLPVTQTIGSQRARLTAPATGPKLLDHKYPNAPTDWRWQQVFPQEKQRRTWCSQPGGFPVNCTGVGVLCGNHIRRWQDLESAYISFNMWQLYEGLTLRLRLAFRGPRGLIRKPYNT